MALTNNSKLASRMRILSSHGITRNPDLMKNAPHGPWYYEQLELGLNYRMSEVHAALGMSQLKKLEIFISQRQKLAKNYDEMLSVMPLRIPGRMDNASSSWHLYIIRLQDAKRHRTIFNKLQNAGIGVNLHYIPVHLQPYYRTFGFGYGDFPSAEEYYAHAISIPLHAGLTEVEQNMIVEEIAKVTR